MIVYVGIIKFHIYIVDSAATATHNHHRFGILNKKAIPLDGNAFLIYFSRRKGIIVDGKMKMKKT